MILLEIVIAILLGVLIGTITGLTPGIHINLVAVITLSLSPLLLQYTTPVILAVFIIALSITHTFTDFLPSTFLGAPTADTALSVLPAHKLLLEGRGYEAVNLATRGSLIGLFAIIILTPLYLISVKEGYSIVQIFIPYILIISSLFLIFRETKSRIWALISFLLAGTLGIGVLNLPTLKQPLFPLFSGLFGTSMLLLSLKDKIKIPQQKITKPKIPKKELVKAIGSGAFASTLCGFLPGMGAAQAAIVASSVFKRIKTETFLILVGAVGTMVMVISFIALYTIEKARNGSVAIISKLIEKITLQNLILFLVVSIVVAILATIITLKLGKGFSKMITKVNYSRLCLGIILLIVLLAIIISGFLGLLVLTISTFVGMIPPLKGIGRNHLMGSLILPVLLYFLL
ncbi:tripartite tricarboxylate transporter permease [Candidatus Woesearchaeota archaeon]|nr:tripartite tricarboxylate transporter permease [Candidatus Woesearchaeota archaeon]